MIRIILVRHGRTGWNVGAGTLDRSAPDRRFRGLIDLPLSAEGITQARVTAARLAQVLVAAVYSSPLERAAHTARIIAEPHGLQIDLAPGLASMNYGQWAGQTHSDVARRWPDRYLQWRHNPFAVEIPGGESMTDLRDRAVASLRKTLSGHTDGETVVMVSHQVVTRVLVCAMAGMPNSAHWTPRQALCNLTTFNFDANNDCFELVGLNDTCHLDPSLPGRSSGPGTRIVLLRHGQTAWNAEPASGFTPQEAVQGPDPSRRHERFRGRTDLPLDKSGHAQARALCQRLQDEQIAAIYTSPLHRTQQTVAPLAQALAPAQIPVQPHKGLLDIDYGEFQGLTHAEASRTHPADYRLWHTFPSQVPFPGGEGLAEVQDRALAFLEKLAAESRTEHRDPAEAANQRHRLSKQLGETVVLVGHQIVNKVIACTLLGLDLDQIWRLRQDTGCLNVYQKAGGLWRVLRLNDTFHLREA